MTLALTSGMLIPLLLCATVAGSQPPPSVCPPAAPCVCVCEGAAGPTPSGIGTTPPDSSANGRPAAAPQGRLPVLVPIAAPIADTVNASVRFYGGPAVVSDAISFALIAGGGSSNDAGLLMLGLAGYGLGAPINHLANGHPERAFESLGIRLLGGGAAFGALMLDVLSHPCDGEASCAHTPSAGLAAGTVLLLAAAAVDDALLAREPARGAHPGVTLAPAVVAGPSLAFVSLGGSF